MSSAFYNTSGVSLGRRAAAFSFMLAVHVLLVVILFLMAPKMRPFVEVISQPITVELLPEPGPQATRVRTVAKAEAASGKTLPKSPAAPAAPAVPVLDEAPPAPPSPPLDLVRLTREELATVNVAMTSNSGARGPRGGGSAGSESGDDSGSGQGAGEGPGGARLYDAQWYRRPTPAELNPYLPAGNRATGWGMIACQMVENYRVENCRELGQSPLGSGLARAVRQAAWQFRVLPPRLGGRPLIGAWVRIRIEYTQGVPE